MIYDIWYILVVGIMHCRKSTVNVVIAVRKMSFAELDKQPEHNTHPHLHVKKWGITNNQYGVL